MSAFFRRVCQGFVDFFLKKKRRKKHFLTSVRDGPHRRVQQRRRAAVRVQVDDVVAVGVGEHDEAGVALRRVDFPGARRRGRGCRVFLRAAAAIRIAAGALVGVVGGTVEGHVPPHRRDGARVEVHGVHRVDGVDLERVAEGAEPRGREALEHSEAAAPSRLARGGGPPRRRRGDDAGAAVPAALLLLLLLVPFLPLLLLLLVLLLPPVPAVVLPATPGRLGGPAGSGLGPPPRRKDPQTGDAQVAVDDLDRVVKDLVGPLGDRGAALGDDDDLVVVVAVFFVIGIAGFVRRGWGSRGRGGRSGGGDAGRGAG